MLPGMDQSYIQFRKLLGNCKKCCHLNEIWPCTRNEIND